MGDYKLRDNDSEWIKEPGIYPVRLKSVKDKEAYWQVTFTDTDDRLYSERFYKNATKEEYLDQIAEKDLVIEIIRDSKNYLHIDKCYDAEPALSVQSNNSDVPF